MQNISTLSVEQQACEAREEKINEEIAALNHAIYVVSEHVCWQSKTSTETVSSDVLPFLPDDGTNSGLLTYYKTCSLSVHVSAS